MSLRCVLLTHKSKGAPRGLGCVILGVTIALVTFWRRHLTLEQQNNHLEEHRTKMLETLPDAAKTEALKGVPGPERDRGANLDG